MRKVADMLSESSSSSDSDINLPGFFALPCDAKFMDSRTVYQAYRGQLEISIKIIYGVLTVHIINGRNLHSENYVSCDAYIKVSLNPDVDQRTLCNTDPVTNDNNPFFDEKFSFELLEDDATRRLYISLWNHVQNADHEFLGAMSFGLHNINSEIKGWFYLLMGELGQSKHLRYNGKKLSTNRISSINADVKWMDSYSMVLKKKNGFGFSLNGSSPVYVSRINPGSAAEECGLKKGDCFVRIGGMNVSRSSSDSVARILRQSVGSMRLEVQRPRELGCNRPSSSRMNSCNSQANSTSTTNVSYTRLGHAPHSSSAHSSSKLNQAAKATSAHDLPERDAANSRSPKQRIEKLSVSPWKPSRRQAEGHSRPISFISQMSNSSHEAYVQPTGGPVSSKTNSKSRLKRCVDRPKSSHLDTSDGYMNMANPGNAMSHRAAQPLPKKNGQKSKPSFKHQKDAGAGFKISEVDYGWVDADGYVQRTSQTLPRAPKQHHQQQHHEQHQHLQQQQPYDHQRRTIASDEGGAVDKQPTYPDHQHHQPHQRSSRPQSYHSTGHTQLSDEPHYEVIPDGYYLQCAGDAGSVEETSGRRVSTLPRQLHYEDEENQVETQYRHHHQQPQHQQQHLRNNRAYSGRDRFNVEDEYDDRDNRSLAHQYPSSQHHQQHRNQQQYRHQHYHEQHQLKHGYSVGADYYEDGVYPETLCSVNEEEKNDVEEEDVDIDVDPRYPHHHEPRPHDLRNHQRHCLQQVHHNGKVLDYRDMNVYGNVRSLPRQNRVSSTSRGKESTSNPSDAANKELEGMPTRAPPPPPAAAAAAQHQQTSSHKHPWPSRRDFENQIDYIDDDVDYIDEADDFEESCSAMQPPLSSAAAIDAGMGRDARVHYTDDVEYAEKAQRRQLALTQQFPSRASLSQSEVDLLEAQAEFQKTCPISPRSPRITRYILNTPRAALANINQDLLYKRSTEMSEISERFYNRANEIVKSEFKLPVKTPIRPIIERYMEAQKENIH